MKRGNFMKEKFTKKIATYLIFLLSICVGILFFLKILTNVSVGAESYDTDIKVNLDKYVNFKVSEQDKGTLVQYNLKTQIKQEEGKEYLPIKESGLTISLNQINGKYPYAVKVITKSTELTNGKTEDIQDNYQYDASTGKVTIKASNENQDGDPINSSVPSVEAKDEYLIICYYDTYQEQPVETEIGLKVELKSVLFEDNRVVDYQDEFKETVKEDIGKLTSVSYVTDEIYNGYIKSNVINGTQYNTQYKETQSITVSKKEAQEKIKVLENNTFVKIEQNQTGEEIKQDLGNNGRLVYKSTKIKKADITKVLGQDGIIEILDKDETVIATIDKNTQFAEDGTIIINYENEPDTIIVRTSAVQNEGILNLENTKEIKSTMLDIVNTKIKIAGKVVGTNEEVKILEDKEVKNQIETFSNDYENIVDIKESQTNVQMELSDIEWTNKQQNEVIFDVYINSNTIKDNMLKNPTIKIELPSQVEKVVLGSSSVVYANGLKLQEPFLEKSENGNIVIVANLVGTQKQYDENTLGLITDVKIAASVILNKDIQNSVENVNLTYTNQYTLDGSTEIQNKTKEVNVESYQEETTTGEEGTTLEFNNTATVEDIQGLTVEVLPVKGDTVLKDGDTVYEGEFIKYNVKVTNTSDKKIDNIKIIGTIPDGTTYGELEADYYSVWGKYEYNYNKELKEKILEIGSLEPGESNSLFYEVKVDDLQDEEQEKQITNTIKTYVGELEILSYVINNKIKQAEVQLFMEANLKGLDPDEWNYFTYLTSNEDKTVNIEIKVPLIYEIENISNSSQQENINNINISEDNIITAKVDLKANSENILLIRGKMNSKKITNKTDESEIELQAVSKATSNNNIYTSNENRIKYGYDNISLVMTSETEGENVKNQEVVNYRIVVKNIGKCNLSGKATYIRLSDFLPDNLKPISVKYENWIEEKELVDEENNFYDYTGIFNKEQYEDDITSTFWDENGEKLPNVDLYLTIPYGESINIDVKTMADSVSEKTKIENCVFITGNTIDSKTSNIITHTILPYDYEENEDPDVPVNPDEPDNPSDNKEKYSISGIAWLDENEDGKRQTSEKLLEDIIVMLVDTKNASVIKDKQKTDSKGTYRFSELEKGNYIVVFNYDTDTYSMTQYRENGVSNDLNCDVTDKEIILSGKKTKVGLTDILSIDASVNNIDIGLVKNKVCDLRLDKYISKVIVKTESGTKEQAYDNTKLAKVEIKSKEIQDATVVVEYKIIITNEGEIETSVNKIVDYLPEGLEFSSELNKNWIQNKNGEISNTSLLNKKIKPGESTELTLIATKLMTENDTGTFTNIAEIGEISNTLGTKDIDSTPGNKVETEDDYSKAELIISISTGNAILYIGITILSLVIIATSVKFTKLKFVKFIVVIMFSTIALFIYCDNAIAIKKGDNSNYLENVLWIRNPTVRSGGNKFYDVNGNHVGNCNDEGWHASDTQYQKYEKYDEFITGINVIGTPTVTESATLEKVKDNDNEVTIEEKNGNYIIGPLKVKSNTSDYTYLIKTKSGKEIEDGINVTKNVNGGITTFSLSVSQTKINAGDYIEEVTVTANKEVIETTKYKATINGYYKPKNQFSTSPYTWQSGSEEYCSRHKENGWFKEGSTFYQGVEVIKNKEISDSKGKTSSFSLDWKINKGSLEIIKYNDDNPSNREALSGAKFQVKRDGTTLIKATGSNGNYKYSSSGNVSTFETNSEGKITISNLPIGNYTVTETAAPEGYYISSENDNNIIINPAKTTSVKMYNKSSGSLKIFKRDEGNTNKVLSGAKFNVKKDGKFVVAQKIDDRYEYLSLMESNVNNSVATSEFVTDKDGCIEITNLPQGKYEIIEIQAPEGYEIVLKTQIVEVKGAKRNTRIEYLKDYIKTITEKQSYTDRDFEKWWEIITNGANMTEDIRKNLEFAQNMLLDNQSNEKELNSDIKNIMIDYIFNNYAKSNFDYYDATIRELESNNLPEGPAGFVYVYLSDIYTMVYGTLDELEILSWLYKVQGGTPIVIYNKIARIDISGYVWEDGWNGKTDGRDGLFNTNGTDRRLSGVYIRLVDNNGNIVKDEKGNNYELVTNISGQYKFKKVEVDKLADYHVEFSYNGMSYQSVNFNNSTLKEPNSNKSVEVGRDIFNKKFTTVEKNVAIGENNSRTDLQYYSSGHASRLQLYEGQTNFANIPTGYLQNQKVYEKYIITAKTYKNIVYDNNKVLGTGLDKNNKSYVINTLEDISKNNITEITGLNLGVYEREQPDIALHKDVYKATVSVNNKSYDYMFNRKLGETKQGTDTTVGVEFINNQGDNPYRLPIYKADYVYEGKDGAGKFNASITYKIALVNESTKIYAKVNSIVDYYSSDKLQYSKIEIGDINATQLTQLQNVSVKNNNGELRANNLNITIEPGKAQYLYITFNLIRPDSDIGKYFDTNINASQAYNIAEITSYSTYSDNNYTTAYGGIDRDSAPDNLDRNRYNQTAEDDNDKAPGLNIIGSQRQITGTVFADITNVDKQNKEKGRLGNGIYDNEEKGIDGVTVILFDNNTGKMYNTTTKDGGNFTISNFVAGNYLVQYIWGKDNGGKSTLEYKATIYNNKERLEDVKWYTKDVEKRYSDALDDIDDNYLNNPVEKTMVSVTPNMDIGIEKEDYTLLDSDKHIYQINNVDFGIAQRSKQEIEINKFVKEATIKLQNGQTVINYNKDNDVTQGVQKLEQVTDVTDEVIWMQLDNELVHGSTLNVTYGIQVKNNSEYDYIDMDYYKFGNIPTDSDKKVKKITPTVYDYLDSSIQWAKDNQDNPEKWEKVKDITTYSSDEYQKGPTIIEEWYSSNETTDDAGKKVYTYETLKETYGKDIFDWSTETFIKKRTERLANKSILYNSTLTNELKPGESSEEVSFKASKILSTADEIELNNVVEVTGVSENKGNVINPNNSKLTSKTTIIITPGTGEDKSYAIPIAVGVLSFVILSGGIILIKKKVLK